MMTNANTNPLAALTATLHLAVLLVVATRLDARLSPENNLRIRRARRAADKIVREIARCAVGADFSSCERETRTLSNLGRLLPDMVARIGGWTPLFDIEDCTPIARQVRS